MMGLHHFLIALTTKGATETDIASAKALEGLIELADISIKAADPESKALANVSVAPGGLMIAFREGSPDMSRIVVEMLGKFARRFRTPDLCVAVTAGLLDPVREEWISTNFEGIPAIAAARILSKLDPGDFALFLPGHSMEAIGDIWPMLSQGEARTLPGKHKGEEFKVMVAPGVFLMDEPPIGAKQKTDVDLVVSDPEEAKLARYVERFILEISRMGVEHYIDLHLQWTRKVHSPTTGGETRSPTKPTTIAQAAEDFSDRPIGLVGAPGAGKTTVLLQYLRTLHDDVTHIPVYVPMALYRPGRDIESLLNLRRVL